MKIFRLLDHSMLWWLIGYNTRYSILSEEPRRDTSRLLAQKVRVLDTLERIKTFGT